MARAPAGDINCVVFLGKTLYGYRQIVGET